MVQSLEVPAGHSGGTGGTRPPRVPRRTTAARWCPAAQEFVVPPVVPRRASGPSGRIDRRPCAGTPTTMDAVDARSELRALPRRPSRRGRRAVGRPRPDRAPRRLRRPAGAAGPVRAGPARPPDLGHGPLQLPLPLLHAGRGVRARLRVPAARGGPVVRGDRAARDDLRRPRGPQAPDHRRRAARPPQPAGAHRLPRAAPDGRRRAGRPHADDQRLRAARPSRRRSPRPGCSGSRSASTRSTTRCSAR